MTDLTDAPVPPPPAPGPAPIFPTLPSATAKNITHVLLMLAALLTGIGGSYSKIVETDPEIADKISEKVNVPGLVASGGGILLMLVGIFQQNAHAAQAKVAVAQALSAPPVDSSGRASVGHTLNTALTQASQAKDFATAGQVLDLLAKIGKVAKEGA